MLNSAQNLPKLLVGSSLSTSPATAGGHHSHTGCQPRRSCRTRRQHDPRSPAERAAHAGSTSRSGRLPGRCSRARPRRDTVRRSLKFGTTRDRQPPVSLETGVLSYLSRGLSDTETLRKINVGNPCQDIAAIGLSCHISCVAQEEI